MACNLTAHAGRLLTLSMLALALPACGEDAGPAAPKLFIFGPTGYASYANDAEVPTDLAVQTYDGTRLTKYSPSSYSANGGSLTLPSVDLAGDTWMSVEGLLGDGTVWLGSSPLMSVNGETVPGTIPVFTGPPNRFFSGYEIGFGDAFSPISDGISGEPFGRPAAFADAASRAGAAIAQAPDGKGFYVVGGANYSGGTLSNLANTIEWYDPYDGRFKLVTSKGCSGAPADCAVTLDNARAFATANIVKGGRLFVAGGLTGGVSGLEATASIEVFTVSGATAQRVNAGVPFDLLTPRAFHTATVFEDGSLLVVGGFSGSVAAPGTFPTMLEFWNPSDPGDMIESATQLNRARAMHTATFIAQRGHGLMVVGGRTNTEVVADAAIIYKQKNAADFSIQSWSVGSCASGSPLCRWGHTATLVQCSAEMPRVMFTGGYAALGTGANSLLVGGSPIATVGIFDSSWLKAAAPAPNDYTRVAAGIAADSALAHGFGASAAFSIGSDFVFAGGIDGSGNPVATGRRFTVDTGSCEPTGSVAADLTAPRAFGTGLRNDGQGLVFVAGSTSAAGASDWFYGDNFKFATN